MSNTPAALQAQGASQSDLQHRLEGEEEKRSDEPWNTARGTATVPKVCFLHVAYGLISDIDILSEPYRRLGEARFTLMAIRLILAKRSYRARVSILPYDGGAPGRPTRQDSGSGRGSNTNVVVGQDDGVGVGEEEGKEEERGVHESTGAVANTRLISGDCKNNEEDAVNLSERNRGSGWLVLEDDFVLIWAVQTTHST
eukprot:gene19190-24278_t